MTLLLQFCYNCPIGSKRGEETMTFQQNQAALKLQATDLGAFKNSLGILSPDFTRINPKALFAVTGLNPSQLEKVTGIARPQFYKKHVQLKPSSKLLKNIISLVIATDVAFELFNHSAKETEVWLMAPNTILFGDSPFEVCMRGEGDKLIEWLNKRLNQSLSQYASN